MIRLLLLGVALLSVSGCARMIQGSSQDVTIETPGADGATCFIENEEFRYKIYAPQTIRMTKTVYPLNVRCLAPGNRQKTVVVPLKIQEEVFMNVVNGFVPGAWFDYESRSFYKMPEKVVVDFTDMAPTTMPLPKYDRLLHENPHLRGWEEFRPGLPALQRDLYDAPIEMRKRDVPAAEEEAVIPPPSGVPAARVPTGGSADSLAREMNPGVFQNSGSAPVPLLRDDGWVK